MVLQEAKNQLGDQRRDKAGEDTDQQSKENVGRIMCHQIIPGEHHQQNPDCTGNKPTLTPHEAEAGDTGGGCRNMAGGEREAVFGRCADKLPPLTELIHGFKRPRPCNLIFQDDIGDQRAAADSTEHADTGAAKTGKEHQHDCKKEEQDALFAEKRNDFVQRSENRACELCHFVCKGKNCRVITGKETVQPKGFRSQGHTNTFFLCNLLQLDTLYSFCLQCAR